MKNKKIHASAARFLYTTMVAIGNCICTNSALVDSLSSRRLGSDSVQCAMCIPYNCGRVFDRNCTGGFDDATCRRNTDRVCGACQCLARSRGYTAILARHATTRNPRLHAFVERGH